MIYLILALVIGLLTALFAFQNPGVVTLKFFHWQFEGSLALVAVGIFALGFLFNFLLSIASLLRHRWTIYNHRKRIKELEVELVEREKRPLFK